METTKTRFVESSDSDIKICIRHKINSKEFASRPNINFSENLEAVNIISRLPAAQRVFFTEYFSVFLNARPKWKHLHI